MKHTRIFAKKVKDEACMQILANRMKDGAYTAPLLKLPQPFVKSAFWEEQDSGHHCTVVPVICVPSRLPLQDIDADAGGIYSSVG